jgi:hypothetical protein
MSISYRVLGFAVCILALTSCATHKSLGLTGVDEKVVNGHWTAINKIHGVECGRQNGELMAKARILVEAYGGVGESYYLLNCNTGKFDFAAISMNQEPFPGGKEPYGWDHFLPEIQSHGKAMCGACAKRY